MRADINLRSLKKSSIRKYRKISEKAKRLSSKGLDIKDPDTKSLQDKFPELEIKQVMGGAITIASKLGRWMIVNERRFLVLYHMNISIENRKNRERYHIQDVFSDIDYALASIVTHDQYVLGVKRASFYEIEDMVKERQCV